MADNSQLLQNGSPSDHLPAIELIPNPENHGNPMSEKDHYSSSLTSQPQNQSCLDNIGSDENINDPGPLHALEAQLQSLRIGSNHVYGNINITNQPILTAGNFAIGPRHAYDERLLQGNNVVDQRSQVWNSEIEPSHVYNRLCHGNNTNQQSLVGYFGSGPSHVFGNQQTLVGNFGIVPTHVFGNNTNQQTLVGSFGIAPSHVYEGLANGNNTNKQTLAGNAGIGPSDVSNSSSSAARVVMRQRYNNITSLEVVKGMVASISKEEDGSEFLLRMLDGKNPRDINFISTEVLDDLHDLMMDQFGKRVIQKIFDVLKEDQLTLLFEFITNNLVKFQNDILGAMASECSLIAANKTGCSVLQTCLSIAPPQSCFLLICAISRRVSLLAPHQYGNYVVQYVIKLACPAINEEIVNRLRGHYVELSMDKYASNVVEDLLRFSTQKNVVIIVQEITSSPSFVYLLQDPFGNYVAQRALECSQGALYDMLVSTISRHHESLRTNQYGKRVLAFMYGGKWIWNNAFVKCGSRANH
ncbi:pumilio homolog 12-like [Neltuma alba]|uniref:pumilio homolog 12-like n=1 Tax=Neltuma alba TaxID=207710 RepID=UPI0010A45754|nr:pumilio homolog 12-like [Prosopis alba]